MSKIILLTCFVLCTAVINAQSQSCPEAAKTYQQCVKDAATAKEQAAAADPKIQEWQQKRQDWEKKAQEKKDAMEKCFTDNGCNLDDIKAKIAHWNKTRQCKEAIHNKVEQQVAKCFQDKTGQALPEGHKRGGRGHGHGEGPHGFGGGLGAKGGFGGKGGFEEGHHEEGHFEGGHFDHEYPQSAGGAQRQLPRGKFNKEAMKQSWIDKIAKSPACNASGDAAQAAGKVVDCLGRLWNDSKPAKPAAQPAAVEKPAEQGPPAFIQAFCDAKAKCLATFKDNNCTQKDLKAFRKSFVQALKNCTRETRNSIKTGEVLSTGVAECDGVNLTRDDKGGRSHWQKGSKGEHGPSNGGRGKDGPKKGPGGRPARGAERDGAGSSNGVSSEADGGKGNSSSSEERPKGHTKEGGRKKEADGDDEDESSEEEEHDMCSPKKEKPQGIKGKGRQGPKGKEAGQNHRGAEANKEAHGGNGGKHH